MKKHRAIPCAHSVLTRQSDSAGSSKQRAKNESTNQCKETLAEHAWSPFVARRGKKKGVRFFYQPESSDADNPTHQTMLSVSQVDFAFPLILYSPKEKRESKHTVLQRPEGFCVAQTLAQSHACQCCSMSKCKPGIASTALFTALL